MKEINIHRLKEFVIGHFPANSTLRQIIAMDKDRLTVGEFLAKIDVWLKILRTEKP